MRVKSPAVTKMVYLIACVAGVGCEARPAVNDEPTRLVTETANPNVEEADVPIRARAITFDQLKFELQPDERFHQEHLPEIVPTIVDTRIRISGFMMPGFLEHDITQFVLVKYLSGTFAPTYPVSETIVVQMQEGASLSYSSQPITVEGTFTIEPFPDVQNVLAVYRFVDAIAIEARQQ